MEELVVDLHIHSHYSRATSKECNLEGLYKWGKLKGINIIGTGDFTHPLWLEELLTKLVPAEPGLYKLHDHLAAAIDAELPSTVKDKIIRFVPSVEIATIYRKGDKVRKLHQLVVMPNFAAVERLNARLGVIGNLRADGRPILGLDSKELLRFALESDPQALFIPAHIWTPWFGLFGSKSGFDSLYEAYDELTPEIRAIETGLSSDPQMNWRLSQLDNLAIISNSDAHSPQKLGREATVVRADMSYEAIIGAFKTNDERLVGTIEFFPEEGKYHADGHRLCDVRFSPSETKAHKGICPKCAKPLVVGVDYRVNELADRSLHGVPRKQVEYIVPLVEVIAELRGVKTVAGKAVMAEYHRLINNLDSEFAILRHLPLEAIYEVSPQIAMAVGRMRAGEVHRDAGFDGVFGTIKMFKDENERGELLRQISLV